ncbi:hypothetical protein JX265_001889 [Neoarthrinium moseri]|uniref:Uncharacterized protein n=1 Tax=Neoarthrinium moseri TaxID=1658444 RepID=A0A9P9WW10_9PEZI|nr:hypothetical protein JX265_001889 [Neoarthrinium moseri]
MDRLRPGDVSPMVTTLDEYRQTHDVSPLSPATEDEPRTPRRGRSRRWRHIPNEAFAVSPESPPKLVDRTWLADESDARSASPKSPDTPAFGHQVWDKELSFGGQPHFPPQPPSPEGPQEESRLSLDSLQETTPDEGGEKSKTRNYPAATPPGATPTPAHHENWDSPWLRELTLIALALAFAVVAVAILALYVVSSKNIGLGSYIDPVDLVYLWKFIPTSVLASLLAIWNCVDINARLLQPWANLREGPSSTERTIFLDLVSPPWLITCKATVLKGFYVPMLTISGVLLLNILVILSTSLLQVEPELMHDYQLPSIGYVEDRVQVKLGTAATLITLLLACLGISVAVLYKRPQCVVPRNPQSIGGLAFILQGNLELSHHFRSNYQHLRYHLQHERFSTISNGHTFALVREGMNPSYQPAKEIREGIDTLLWWQPLALRIWSRVLAIVFPLALIGALEGVQHVSDDAGGMSIAFFTDAAHYGVTIIPAIIMWGTSMLYSSINFNTILMSPYCALTSGASSSRGLFTHNLGRLPLLQMLSSFRRRHMAAGFTSAATMVGPFLIIIVSGLYTIKSSSHTSETQTGQLSLTYSNTKIIQNRAPKLALQVLLGFMALCNIVAWASMRTRGILPHNPSSIAGAATLLAGGELWKGDDEQRRGLFMPSEAAWRSERELKRQGLWAGVVFGLGWWPDGRFGIDAGGPIDDGG